jgi:WASH complex subunit strumpellin
VILFFAPDILHSRESEMREYVDKHYNDNWMITIHMGYVVDLSVQWRGYKAAKKALANIMTSKNISDAANQNLKWFQEAKVELAEFLTAGILNEQYVLVNLNKLMQCLRKSNVALRWRLLHRSCENKQIKDMISAQLSASAVIDLLLTSAQLEYKVKNIVGELLDGKAEKWEQSRSLCAGRLRELSDYFTGEKALTRVKKDERMMSWFASIAAEIDSLNESTEGGAGQHSTVLGRKIQKAISALEEVEQFEQIDTDVQIKQFLFDTRELLKQMIRIVNIRRQDLTKIEVITDLSYGFEVLNDYTSVIHTRVRAEPTYSVLLRAGFVKLSSILDVPLTRINEINSADVVSVAQFYSTEIVDFMRRVLDIIPRSVFEILQKIIKIQTSQLKPLPVKFESQYLKEYAQLDERYQLAEMTHRASTFTEGVLEMESTVLGIIKVDARQILHDGLRKELVRQVSEAMHSTLIFTNEKTGVASLTQADVRLDFNRQMKKLSSQMDGFRRSIEYIQDYVDMAGLKMWQEELARIVNFNIEQECNRYLKKKVLSHDSKHQNKVIPIPTFKVPTNAGSINSSATNFMGRTMNALLAMTDPGTTIFGPESIGWFNPDGAEVCGIKTFSTMNQAINVTGTSGLDRLLGFRIVHELGFFLRFYDEQVKPFFPHLEKMRNALFPDKALPDSVSKLYGAGLKRFEKLMGPMLKVIMKMGQAQLLRRQLSQVLQFSCRLDANLLYQALTTLDTAVLTDVEEHFKDPDNKPYPEPKTNPLLGQLNKLLEASGLSDPLAKIYVVTDPIESLPVLLMFFVVTYMSKLTWDQDFATLVRRKPAFAIDGMPLVVGIWTLLKQFHPSYTRQLLAYLGQFIRATMDGVLKADFASLANSKTGAMPLEVTNTLLFVDMFCKVGKIPRSAVAEFIPSYMFDAVNVSSPNPK